MRKEDLSIDNTFYPCQFSLDTTLILGKKGKKYHFDHSYNSFDNTFGKTEHFKDAEINLAVHCQGPRPQEVKFSSSSIHRHSLVSLSCVYVWRIETENVCASS
jgi:hypothetical protein